MLEPLGTGGNSEVWLAEGDGATVALKLVGRKPETEPYQRFVREVTAVQKLKDLPGVLPVLETDLPENPSRQNPAWIAMPVAAPVRDALVDAPLDEIVAAVLAFAETLAELADRGLSHRDIKPGNLYRYESRWVVGDFGLVSLPDAGGLTGDRLGPFGFMPDEMFANASTADGNAADVFQLAKTFTALATRQEYPPQGHIPSGSSGALSRYVVHPRIEGLEDLIHRCTRRDPEARPTMRDVAQEMEAWLSVVDQEIPDLSDVAARFRAANAESLASRERLALLMERFQELADQAFPRLLDPVAQTLSDAGLTPTLEYFHTMSETVTRHLHLGSRPSLADRQAWVVGEYGRVEWPEQIAVGVGFDLDDEGLFWCTAYVGAGDMRTIGGGLHFQFEERTTAVENNAAIEAILATLAGEITDALKEALSRLADRG